MATFYLDPEGGNNTNDGTSFANRWRTITSGATAARIAPGDIIRVMASTEPTLVDSAASWTDNSKTVTLSGALTADISTCETAWTASANVTTVTTATRKEGALATQIAVAAAFTTGKAAYLTITSLNLAAYQQVSFWVRCTSTTVAASVLSLRLCTDLTGDVSVHTIPIPAINATSVFQPVTVDLGTNLNAAILSVALYCDSDPGTVTITLDNIIACKASANADALTLRSLIGKVHSLSWVASTTYASDSTRIPTSAGRTGYCYKVTAGGGGNSGGSEPAWPKEIGVTVADGALTWTCFDLEDSWFPIQSIRGTTVLIDNSGGTTLANAGQGYSGTTESVATYKRECVVFPGAATANTAVETIQASGTDADRIAFTFGWNRTDMSTRTGQTWWDGTNSLGVAISTTFTNFNTVDGVNIVRYAYVSRLGGSGHEFSYAHAHGLSQSGVHTAGAWKFIGCNFSNNAAEGLRVSGNAVMDVTRCVFNSNILSGWGVDADSVTTTGKTNEIMTRNNATYGIFLGVSDNKEYRNVRTGNNGVAAFNITSNVTRLVNCSIPESTEFTTITSRRGFYVYSQKHDKVADNHLITTDGGTIISATDQRHTASGISWKFRPTSTTRNSTYPLVLSVAKIKVESGVTTSITIWTRRDNANIKGRLIVEGGQIGGVMDDLFVDCTPTVDTWIQSSTLSITPTETGAVEVKFYCWDGVGTTNNFWVDDLAVT